MDTFIDKLAQKRNAQEIIRANTTAEAIKTAELQKQIEIYDTLLQEMRKVNLKTADNADQAKKILEECVDKLKLMQQENDAGEEEKTTLDDMKAFLQSQSERTDDFMHKENVKVYRNVQASMVEELQKQTEEIKTAMPKQSVGTGFILPISVLILLGVIADIIIHLLNITIKL